MPDRIARALLLLTEDEREHLFLLGLGRPPAVRHRLDADVPPRLQRVLDAMPFSPALLKTATWDVVAWNRAASVVLSDDAALPPERRNVLRLMFRDPRVRAAQADWERVARFVVAVFRANAARRGGGGRGAAGRRAVPCQAGIRRHLARQHSQLGDVSLHGGGVKRLRHPTLGEMVLEYSAFAVDGRPDLAMVVYEPATTADAERVAALVRAAEATRPGRGGSA